MSGGEDSSQDRFASFLALLSAHLDDHHLIGPDLAAELYVSRSLLDRLVAATAGETTSRLRRRLLLERAASRLRTSDVSVRAAGVHRGRDGRACAHLRRLPADPGSRRARVGRHP